MFNKTTATALTVFALLIAAAPASAQHFGALDLTMTPSVGIEGVYGIVAPGQKVEIKISQSRLGDLAGRSRMQLYAAPTTVFGQLDVASAVLLVEAKIAPGGSLSVVFNIPEALDNTVWTLQALATYEQGGFATSNAFTAIINSEFFAPAPRDPSDPDAGAAKETHADESEAAKM